MADHCDNDKESHLLRYSFNSNHKLVELKYFKIIDSSYHNNRLERKILKARYNKHYKPCLNTKEQSVQLKLLVKYLFKSRHLPIYNYFTLKDGLWKSLDQNYILNKCSILYVLLYYYLKTIFNLLIILFAVNLYAWNYIFELRLAFYCIFFWKQPPLILHLSGCNQNGCKIISIKKPRGGGAKWLIMKYEILSIAVKNLKKLNWLVAIHH